MLIERRKLVAVVEWASVVRIPVSIKGAQGVYFKAKAQLRNIRDTEDGFLLADAFMINLTERVVTRLGELSWGARLAFSANVETVDIGGSVYRLNNPRGFTRIAFPLTPPETVAFLAQMRNQSQATKQSSGNDESDEHELDDEPFDEETSVHELGHAIVADATGGWVDMLEVSPGEDRRGNKYSGACRSYEQGDELTGAVAGYAAEQLANDNTELYLDQFDGDYSYFRELLIDQKIRSAILLAQDKGLEEAAAIDVAIASMVPLSDEEVRAEWESATDRAILLLLERRPLFDLVMEALKIRRYLWHGTLARLGFSRLLSGEERNRSTDQQLEERIARSKRLSRFNDRVESGTA